jgi:anti-anti-sigma factor
MTRLEVERIDGVPVAHLLEDVDSANFAAVERRLAETVAPDAMSLIVDLGAVRYVDSAGIDMLLRLGDRLDQRRNKLILVIPEASPLTRLIKIVGLPEAIAIHPSLDGALAGQRSGGSSRSGDPGGDPT